MREHDLKARLRAVANGAAINTTYGAMPIASLEAFKRELAQLLDEAEARTPDHRITALEEERLGLSRVRLAELLYEHEGFVDPARGDGAPDREVPSWIEESLNAAHSGDCTNECHSCLTCHAKWALEAWDEFAAMLARARAALTKTTQDKGERA